MIETANIKANAVKPNTWWIHCHEDCLCMQWICVCCCMYRPSLHGIKCHITYSKTRLVKLCCGQLYHSWRSTMLFICPTHEATVYQSRQSTRLACLITYIKAFLVFIQNKQTDEYETLSISFVWQQQAQLPQIPAEAAVHLIDAKCNFPPVKTEVNQRLSVVTFVWLSYLAVV